MLSSDSCRPAIFSTARQRRSPKLAMLHQNDTYATSSTVGARPEAEKGLVMFHTMLFVMFHTMLVMFHTMYSDYALKIFVLRLVNLVFRLVCYSHYSFLVLPLTMPL
jgi:hypothetical protein